MPFYNERLDVEAVGFRDFGGDELGILVSPWFMNLLLLPRGESLCEFAVGTVVSLRLPGGRYELTVCRDERLGSWLSLALFTEVSAIPSQATARDIATEILAAIFRREDSHAQARPATFGRRRFLTGSDAD